MGERERQVREAFEQATEEMGRSLGQALQIMQAAADDLGRWLRDGPRGPAERPTRSGESPVELIRQLGQLRDDGLITEEEFAAKKAELLDRIA